MLFSLYQPGLERIAFHVLDQVLKFLRRADPMVERLVLPEARPGAAQNLVSDAELVLPFSHRMMAGIAVCGRKIAWT